MHDSMEHEINDLDIEALRKEILRKCKKEPEHLAPRKTEDTEYRKEDIQEEETASMKTDEIAKEELPFDEILAEKRRKYTAKEDFIYSMYNNILPAFVTKWDGYFLRKKSKTLSENGVEVTDEGEEMSEDDDSLIEEKEKEERDTTFVPPWKLSLPDEFANITFYNDNSYSGRVSRKMMEGEGIYTWHNGVRYEGQFEQNRIQGRGLLKWDKDCWYEGDFMDGLRHGEGIMVDEKCNRTYAGQWHMGRKYVKGKE